MKNQLRDRNERGSRLCMATVEHAYPDVEIPLTPSVEVWRAMSPRAKQRFIEEVNSILSSPPHFMGESVPHSRAKRRAMDRLRKHFDTIGKVIYLGEELSVLYPNEAGFTPDILAVCDVPETEEDERSAWVVADEGRGLDMVLEVLYEGDRKKDTVHNVERYARLGIPEYFVYDRKKQHLLGYRLPTTEARRYQRIMPQGGRYASAVLGLDLAIVDNKLEFFHGMSEIFGSEDLIARLQTMMNSLEAKAEQAEAKAEQAEAKAEQAEAKAEQAEAKAEQAEAKAEQAVTSLQDAVLAIANARGLGCSSVEIEKVRTCVEPSILQQWLVRVATAKTMADVVSNDT